MALDLALELSFERINLLVAAADLDAETVPRSIATIAKKTKIIDRICVCVIWEMILIVIDLLIDVECIEYL